MTSAVAIDIIMNHMQYSRVLNTAPGGNQLFTVSPWQVLCVWVNC